MKAVICLWASLALGLVRSLLDWEHLAAQAAPGFTISVLVSIVVLSAVLIYKISHGRNWARIAYLVLTLVGTLPFLPQLPAEFMRSPVIGVINSIQLGLHAFALYLLFTAPGKSWFKRAAVPA